ncbi:MAG: hypothetical protein E7A62_09800, partial [Actinomycetaceae bacterium]|nr:hypothetical protein [Actinomycetaceae bacterium]MDU0971262.1 hypothetical protein [Actinomycetaceae bacterium]
MTRSDTVYSGCGFPATHAGRARAAAGIASASATGIASMTASDCGAENDPENSTSSSPRVT